MPSELGLVKYPNTRGITVTTDPQKLVTENRKRKAFLVYNNGSATVYILNAQNKAVADGIPVAAGSSYTNDDCYGEYWIIAASGSQNVRIEEDTD